MKKTIRLTESKLCNIIKESINKRFKDAFWYYDYMNDKLIDEGNFLVSNVILPVLVILPLLTILNC